MLIFDAEIYNLYSVNQTLIYVPNPNPTQNPVHISNEQYRTASSFPLGETNICEWRQKHIKLSYNNNLRDKSI